MVRVRFAPSPTGGLHLGGIRTILYNYLFAKKNNGSFILRIEDTDQKRFVPGAEEYILKCFEWLGIEIDESVQKGGKFGPYKQSERQMIYQQHIQTLINKGVAYYAFDTPEELNNMRQNNPSIQYDYQTRLSMKNSLTLSPQETQALIQDKHPHVIRLKIPQNEQVIFKDLLRGDILFDTNLLDDKVLIKADGLPTYHFAVVIDDYLMQISHVFRGEEWLPSAPIHQLIWEYLGWKEKMPHWIHLPLILKPDGNGKLSKRDGERLDIPIYLLEWTDPHTNEKIQGFKEKGFLPNAVINFLVSTSWNDGSAKEIFSITELIQNFSIERLQHHGSKFDYNKAKWFNHEYIQQTANETLLIILKNILNSIPNTISYNDPTLLNIIELTKERCSLLTDLYQQNAYFFHAPNQIDISILQDKWTESKHQFTNQIIESLNLLQNFNHNNIQQNLQDLATAKNIKLNEIQLPLRIMLVGAKFGIGIFHIMEILGKKESLRRIQNGIIQIQKFL